MVNLEQQFTAETARSIASNRRAMMAKKSEELSNNIVDYVNSVYKGEIQKAIDKNVYCNTVRIKLPKTYRKALLKLSENEFFILRGNVNGRLSKDGFQVVLGENSWSCGGCPWKYLACTKYYNIQIKWRS